MYKGGDRIKQRSRADSTAFVFYANTNFTNLTKKSSIFIVVLEKMSIFAVSKRDCDNRAIIII